MPIVVTVIGSGVGGFVHLIFGEKGFANRGRAVCGALGGQGGRWEAYRVGFAGEEKLWSGCSR